ncbi:hypothetical protein PCCS19_39930 [Paenibacillus sp. CCS19]|nr:hypothetical protein PCCS19_39930 [Paenibacillus cellulosilyticus]
MMNNYDDYKISIHPFTMIRGVGMDADMAVLVEEVMILDTDRVGCQKRQAG